MTKTLFQALMLAGVVLSLAACEETKKQFDLSKKAPDEFAVVTRAPLEMPPDFNIRAPQPGAQRPQEESTTNMAKAAVLGEDATKAVAQQNGVSEGEAVLLQKTGANKASDAIRATVDAEAPVIADEKTPGIDKLKSMVGAKVDPKADVVDPVAETNRLKQNKATGKAITDGKTPTVTR